MKNLPTMPRGIRNAFKYFGLLNSNPTELGQMAAKYGDVVLVYLAMFIKLVFVSLPEYVEAILQNKNGEYIKGPLPKQIGGDYLGEKLLVMAEAEDIDPQRKALAPFAHWKQLQVFVDGVHNIIVQTYEEHVGKRVNLKIFMKTLHLRLATWEFFSQDSARLERLMPELLIVAQVMKYKMLGPFFYLFFGKKYQQYLKVKNELFSIILDIINERRKATEPPFDMLQALLTDEELTAKIQSGELDNKGINRFKMSEEERKKVDDDLYIKLCVQLFVGGSDTGALGGLMVPLRLAHHPEIFARLRAEVDEILQGKLPDHNVWKTLPYTQAVLNEGWRMDPPARILRQVGPNGAMLGGYKLKPGWLITIEMLVVHMDPRWFPHPEVFNPHRFLPGHPEEGKHPRWAFLPFGGGSRVCLGQLPAQLNAAMILAISTQGYEYIFERDAQGNLPAAVTRDVVVREGPDDVWVTIQRR